MNLLITATTGLKTVNPDSLCLLPKSTYLMMSLWPSLSVTCGMAALTVQVSLADTECVHMTSIIISFIINFM